MLIRLQVFPVWEKLRPGCLTRDRGYSARRLRPRARLPAPGEGEIFWIEPSTLLAADWEKWSAAKTQKSAPRALM
jgi:hypothetical protein